MSREWPREGICPIARFKGNKIEGSQVWAPWTMRVTCRLKGCRSWTCRSKQALCTAYPESPGKTWRILRKGVAHSALWFKKRNINCFWRIDWKGREEDKRHVLGGQTQNVVWFRLFELGIFWLNRYSHPTYSFQKCITNKALLGENNINKDTSGSMCFIPSQAVSHQVCGNSLWWTQGIHRFGLSDLQFSHS